MYNITYVYSCGFWVRPISNYSESHPFHIDSEVNFMMEDAVEWWILSNIIGYNRYDLCELFKCVRVQLVAVDVTECLSNLRYADKH